MLRLNKLGILSAAPLPRELLDTLEQETSAAYALDENLSITYCNPAWKSFAQANAGSCFTTAGLEGQPVLNFISEPLKTFYEHIFRATLTTGNPWRQSYECSTPTLFRQFSMHVLKVEGLNALVVTNYLEIECPHLSKRTSRATDSEVYLSDEGILSMCSNCRRVRQARGPEIWDWVPDYLEGSRDNVSHGLCPLCIHQFLVLP